MFKGKRPQFYLTYLPANMAWVFMYGGSMQRMDDVMFHASPILARHRAHRHGLDVVDGQVRMIGWYSSIDQLLASL